MYPPDTDPVKPGARIQPDEVVLNVAIGVEFVGLISAIWAVPVAAVEPQPLAALAAEAPRQVVGLVVAGQAIVAPALLRRARMKFDVVTDEPAISML